MVGTIGENFSQIRQAVLPKTSAARFRKMSAGQLIIMRIINFLIFYNFLFFFRLAEQNKPKKVHIKQE